MSDNAKFGSHINRIVNEANGIKNRILRTFNSRDELSMLTLYKSLILPKLEYCCQLWNPASIGDIEDIEAVQRSFTAKIETVKDKNYWDRLKTLGLYSLQRRRERYCIIYVWKILEGLVPNDIGLKLSKNITRGRTIYIEGTTCNTQSVKTLRNDSFSRNSPRIFNSLPSNLKDISSCTVDTFKKSLDAFLKNIDDTPPIASYENTWPHYNQLTNLLKFNRMRDGRQTVVAPTTAV